MMALGRYQSWRITKALIRWVVREGEKEEKKEQFIVKCDLESSGQHTASRDFIVI